jgi:hypothetical protein
MRGLGESAGDLMTRKLQELKAGILGPSGGEPAPKSTISWWCWDHPGFKDCHQLAFQAAQHQCTSAGKPTDSTCLVTTADALVKEGCQCPSAPPPGKMSDQQMMFGVGALVVAVLVWSHYSGKKEKS